MHFVADAPPTARGERERDAMLFRPAETHRTGAFRAFQRRLAAWAAVPIHAVLGNRVSEAFGILMYHRVAPQTAGTPPPTWSVTPDRLRSQLAGLLRRGHQAWPLRKAIDCHRAGRSVPRNVFVVTFDDGYENVFAHARPILRELQVPATVFVSTGYLDCQTPFPFEDWPAAGSAGVPVSSWRPLSSPQCAELLADGLFELGTHTHLHEDFRARPEALRHDLAASLRVMRTRFGLEDVPFAIPYGLATPELTEAIRSTGVVCGLTASGELVTPASDRFDWGRFGVEPRDTAATLSAKLGGWYGVIRDGWRWLAGRTRNGAKRGG